MFKAAMKNICFWFFLTKNILSIWSVDVIRARQKDGQLAQQQKLE